MGSANDPPNANTPRPHLNTRGVNNMGMKPSEMGELALGVSLGSRTYLSIRLISYTPLPPYFFSFLQNIPGPF